MNEIAGQGRYYPCIVGLHLAIYTAKTGEFAALLLHWACSFAAILNFVVQLLPVSATFRYRIRRIPEYSGKGPGAIGDGYAVPGQAGQRKRVSACSKNRPASHDCLPALTMFGSQLSKTLLLKAVIRSPEN